MQKTHAIRGVPDAVARDAWWFGAEDHEGDGVRAKKDPTPNLRARQRFVALIILIVVADVLFWDQSIGASLAVYALAVFGLTTVDLIGQRNLWRPLALALAGALPVVEMVQPLSIAFLTL